MPSFHRFIAALSSDPIAATGSFLLVVLVVTYIILLTVFARRSVNDLRDQVLTPGRTSEQRQYMKSRRRQRFVAMHGGYPDMFGEDTILREAAKHRRIRAAKAKLEFSRKHINVSPAKRREPYLPKFAPRISADDLFGKISRLEAQQQASPAPRLKKAVSGSSLDAAMGTWWNMLDSLTRQPKAPKSRRHRDLHQKSRSSLGTMAGLLETAEENDEQLLEIDSRPAQAAGDSNEMAISRTESASSISNACSEPDEAYEIRTLNRQPSPIGLDVSDRAEEELADTQRTHPPDVRLESACHDGLLLATSTSSVDACGTEREDLHTLPPATPSSLESKPDRTIAEELVPLVKVSSPNAEVPEATEGEVLPIEKPPCRVSGPATPVSTHEYPRSAERTNRRPSTLGLEYD